MRLYGFTQISESPAFSPPLLNRQHICVMASGPSDKGDFHIGSAIFRSDSGGSFPSQSFFGPSISGRDSHGAEDRNLRKMSDESRQISMLLQHNAELELRLRRSKQVIKKLFVKLESVGISNEQLEYSLSTAEVSVLRDAALLDEDPQVQFHGRPDYSEAKADVWTARVPENNNSQMPGNHPGIPLAANVMHKNVSANSFLDSLPFGNVSFENGSQPRAKYSMAAPVAATDAAVDFTSTEYEPQGAQGGIFDLVTENRMRQQPITFMNMNRQTAPIGPTSVLPESWRPSNSQRSAPTRGQHRITIGGTSVPSQSYGVDKKASRSRHAALEQERRSRINNRINVLRRMVPISAQHPDKASVLSEAIVHIRQLQVQKDNAHTRKLEKAAYGKFHRGSGGGHLNFHTNDISEGGGDNEDADLIIPYRLSDAGEVMQDGIFMKQDGSILIVHVISPDRKGLLVDLTSALEALGVEVLRAEIRSNRELKRAHDIFFLKLNDMQLESSQITLDSIRLHLSRAIGQKPSSSVQAPAPT